MAAKAAVLNILKKKYGAIKEVSGVRYRVLVDAAKFKARAATAKAMAADIGGKVAPDGKSVTADGITYEVKPASMQGSTSSGVTNELNLVNAINYVIKQNGRGNPINIVFKAGTKKYTIKNATGAVAAGSDTAGRKKSDVNITTQTGNRPISLKQDNAEYWESADTLWGKNALPYLQKLLADKKVKLIPQGGGDVFASPNFAVEATDAEKKDVVFGSDILIYKGAVITRTFVGEDFSWDGATNTLTIGCSSIITQLTDIPSTKEVWFLIRNASNRKSIPGYSGLRVMAAYSSRINANVLKITVSQRSNYE
jgi:hypothetical protein